ncbi:MAG: cyclic pyranopterin monophosphate synthase MoaC [Bacteroidetes bacterium]|nr:cyclic pyranopterin monophosphate synthase MoaC [Bacteroidota bacterium]MBU1679247.1 cyclic pyranopterin monophosphate synthase MoaC [Bacteroidota bacterium]MBU2506853.1 cyclic pyranopterin monophosphate synthase MoaC [Bacteroidota bacterium]
MNKLTHVNKEGKANMVYVSEKSETIRTAEAYAEVCVSNELFEKIKNNELTKGDVLTTAKIAGIQGGKRTSELIPLCHNIFISKLNVELKLNAENSSVEIYSYAKTKGVTGIEMEALTAVSIAALTVYDMCKAVDKSIIIKEIKLLSKSGGKSGDYKR